MRCDESSLTGETDPIKKYTFEDSVGQSDSEKKKECFVLSGSKVLEGVGRYVVVAVGERSFNGRILMGTSYIAAFFFFNLICCAYSALRKPTAATPLQEKLNDLAELIAKVGGACGLILFGSLMIKFFVQLKTKPSRYASILGSWL